MAWLGNRTRVACLVALAVIVMFAETVYATGRVAGALQRKRRHRGRTPGSRKLLCRCGCGGGIPPPPPPPPPTYDCSSCPSGYYEESPCTGSSSRVCKTCSSRASTCAAGRYLQGCGPNSPGTCTVCASCEPGLYRSGCSGLSAGCASPSP